MPFSVIGGIARLVPRSAPQYSVAASVKVNVVSALATRHPKWGTAALGRPTP